MNDYTPSPSSQTDQQYPDYLLQAVMDTFLDELYADVLPQAPIVRIDEQGVAPVRWAMNGNKVLS